jgi:hypothetical protein
LFLFAGHFSLSTPTRDLLEALNDEGQQQMAGAWSNVGAAQQEAPEEPEDGVTQQEAPKESDIDDKDDDQPQVTYRLVQF